MNGNKDGLPYWPKISSSTIAALLLHLGLRCSTVGHWGPESPKSASWFSRWHLVSNCLKPSGHLVILFSNVHLRPLFFHLFTQVHLLIDGSVEGQYITIDKTPQNSNCRLCCDVAQKEYKTRHDWVGIVIYWKLCKFIKFDYTLNGICTNQYLSWGMRRTNFFGILKWKRITESWPGNQT